MEGVSSVRHRFRGDGTVVNLIELTFIYLLRTQCIGTFDLR
jgi:hypothetical protein